jgi:2'-phosphotransferase
MSRYLSYLLRHGAAKEGLSIDNEGYVSVTKLLEFLFDNGSEIDTLKELQKITKEDKKQRFSLIQKDGEWFMRANQGHSISTVTEKALISINDPNGFPEVIHGTFRNNLDSILQSGLSRMNRNHIHFASNRAASSGVRSNANIFIYIDLPLALTDGIKFFVSENGVILTPGNDQGILDPKYFKQVLDVKGNNLLLPPEPHIPCAGCIVFRHLGDELQVCLISTHRDVFGFPKGKRNKEESLITCALRELQEETGIKSGQIVQLERTKYVDERGRINNSNPSIRLFVTKLIINQVTLAPVDINEINKCQFLSIDKAMKLLMPKRQEVLTKAIALLN